MMIEHCVAFLLPEDEMLSNRLPLRGEFGSLGEVVTRITLLDTFDWRLFRRGKALEAERSGDGALACILRDLRGDEAERRVAAETRRLPRFARDLSDEALRNIVEPIIDVRALLPRGELKRVRRMLGQLGESVTPTGTLHLDRYSLIHETGESQALANRLVFESLQPSGKASRRLVEQVAKDLSLERAPEDIWVEALAAAGKLPTVETSSLESVVAPNLRADLALKRILLRHCETMQANEPGLIANLDTEFLHDFRVALRRSRSAIGQLKGVFPERMLARYARELSFLGTVTGPTRDLDVYLLEFARLQALLPEFIRQDLTPLRILLEERAEAERAQLVTLLAGRRHRKFIDDWTAFLKKPVPHRPSAPNALTPIGSLLRARIWKLYRRVLKRDDWGSECAPAEAVHELRKTCKKIRYLIEFAQPFFPADKIRKPIKDLKVLQNHLGAFQDADVQIGHLRQWSVHPRFNRSAPAETLLAIGALIGRLDQLQRERRSRIPGALHEFGNKDNRARFRRLFGDRG